MKKEGSRLKKEFLKTMIQLATAAFGLVAALAWNEAIQSIIARLVPENGTGISSKVTYAFVVTVIAVGVTYLLGKMLQDEEDNGKK
jgi:hypothetical protein